MVSAFTLGASTMLLIRFASMKILRWPFLSRPLWIIPEMIVGGVGLSLFDYYRRLGLDNSLKAEQQSQVTQLIRKSEKNYGKHSYL